MKVIWMKPVLFFAVFMVVWLVGCATADQILKLDARAYNMAWGVIVATIAESVANRITDGRQG